MTARLLCKHCKSIISANTSKDVVYCSCGKLGVDGDDKQCKVMHDGNRDSYALVDDQGNEIVVKDSDSKKEGMTQNIEAIKGDIDGIKTPEETFEYLMMAMKNEIDAMNRSSPDRRFSPVTNQDLLALQEWLSVMSYTLRQLMQRSHPTP